jgi:hypothetical protein
MKRSWFMRIVTLLGMLMLIAFSLFGQSIRANPSSPSVISRRYLTQEEFYQKHDKRRDVSSKPSRLLWKTNTLIHAKANTAFSYKILFADVDQYSTVDNPTKTITVLSQPQIERYKETSTNKAGAFQVRDRKKGSISPAMLVQKDGTGDFYEAIIGGVTRKEPGSYVESFVLTDTAPDFSTHEGIEYLSDGTERDCYFEVPSPPEKNQYKDEEIKISLTILVDKETPKNDYIDRIVDIRHKEASDFNYLVHSYHK